MSGYYFPCIKEIAQQQQLTRPPLYSESGIVQYDESHSIWCPALNLAESTVNASVALYLVGHGSDPCNLPPLLWLDPVKSDEMAESISLGLLPSLGDLVQVGQVGLFCLTSPPFKLHLFLWDVRCKQVKCTGAGGPSYEMRTALRPTMHLVLRHLLLLGRLQSQQVDAGASPPLGVSAGQLGAPISSVPFAPLELNSSFFLFIWFQATQDERK